MTTNAYERQKALFAMVDAGVSNIGAGNGFTVKIPRGAMLLSVGVQTVTAFNSATTATATVSDGTTTFVNAVDIKSTGAETSANAPKFYPDGGELAFTFAETGAGATAGRAIGYAQYIQLGAGGSIQE